MPNHYHNQTKKHGVVVKVPDCEIVVSEFELQSPYYVHVRTNTNGKDKNSQDIIPLLFFYKDGFCI